MRGDSTLTKLMAWFKDKGGVIVAFSGGLDSTLVAAVAKRALGKKAIAVTVKTEFISKREIEEATRAAEALGIDHKVVDLRLPDSVRDNPPDRCYICKKHLMSRLKRLAGEAGSGTVVDGTNYDDLSLERPGIKALQEEGIRSPLAELKIGKAQIRELSKAIGLDYTKPANPCLATRFPRGHRITDDEVEAVAAAEDFIRRMGFRIVRVRVYDGTAKIEVAREEIPAILKRNTLEKIKVGLKRLGFENVTLDPEGYRTGSMDQ